MDNGIIKCPNCGEDSVSRCLYDWDNWNDMEYFQQDKSGFWYFPTDTVGDPIYVEEELLEWAVYYKCWECDHEWISKCPECGSSEDIEIENYADPLYPVDVWKIVTCNNCGFSKNSNP